MTNPVPADDQALLDELQRELARLEVDREKAIQKRDRLFVVVEDGDDSGYTLSLALSEVKKIENRIEQVKNLLFQKRGNGDGIADKQSAAQKQR